MIELAILGLLKERPMHGYQLNRELSEQLGGLSRVSYGSLYPSLRRLERQGAITSEPGTTGARRKTVYAITPQGERLFLELLRRRPRRIRPRTPGSACASRSSGTSRPRRGCGCSNVVGRRSRRGSPTSRRTSATREPPTTTSAR